MSLGQIRRLEACIRISNSPKTSYDNPAAVPPLRASRAKVWEGSRTCSEEAFVSPLSSFSYFRRLPTPNRKRDKPALFSLVFKHFRASARLCARPDLSAEKTHPAVHFFFSLLVLPSVCVSNENTVLLSLACRVYPVVSLGG